jgi:hypothetical protein
VGSLPGLEAIICLLASLEGFGAALNGLEAALKGFGVGLEGLGRPLDSLLERFFGIGGISLAFLA